MRVLVITPVFPWPLNMGNRVRIHNFLRELAANHDVHVLTMVSSDLLSEDVEEGQREYAELGISVSTVPRPNRSAPRRLVLRAAREILSRMTGLTEQEFYYGLPRFTKAVRRLLTSEQFDCAIVNYWFTASRATRISPTPIVCDTHDVIVERCARELTGPDTDLPSALRSSSRLAGLAAREARQLSYMDWLICVHDKDRETLASILNVGTPSTAIATVRDDSDLLFESPSRRQPVALFYGALQSSMNMQAAAILATEVWPRVRQLNERAELVIAGSHLGAEVEARLLGVSGVRLVGFVQDLGPLIRSASVVVMPLVSGSGIKGRVLECMAAGTPVVGTRLAFEGLPIRDGEQVLLRSTWKTFAEAVVSVMDDDHLRVALAESARATAVDMYSWRAQYGQISGVLEHAIQRRKSAGDV